MINREGWLPITGLSLVSIVMTVGAVLTPLGHIVAIAVLCWILVIFALFFFRDPEREGPRGERLVVAPADGKVVEIAQTQAGEYLAGNCLRISIFLSILDVHVNRAPVSGVVEYFRYHRGSFRPANKAEAGEVNEHTSIGIRASFGKVLVKQIAGILARRIVCYLREGRKVQQGERFGMIKFGSRVEVFLPEKAIPRVAIGQKVQAGVDVLAEIVES